MRQFRPAGSAGFFSSARLLHLPPGERAAPGGGYHLDLRAKAPLDAEPFAAGLPRDRDFVALAQSALGSVERHVAGEDGDHLDRAVRIGRHLLECACREPGASFGALLHRFAYRHGAPLALPWPSAMAQGEAASLFVRLAHLTGEERFAAAAVDVLAPLGVPVESGGVAGRLPDGGFFPEEYPTRPESHVLNGAIFALWGVHDVAAGLGERRFAERFAEGVDALARNVDRWSLGYWSRYDLYPFRPLPNVASSFYHVLHVDQLRVLGRLAGDERLLAAADRFARRYAVRPARALAFAHKAAFRLIVPRDRT
jgi:hypothetical protein